MFHVKHHPDRPHFVPFQCAPESPAKPAELVLRMFQPSEHRPREENAMFRSSCLNLSGPAGIAPCFGFKSARPDADSFSPKYTLKIPQSTPSRSGRRVIRNRSHNSRKFFILWNVE